MNSSQNQANQNTSPINPFLSFILVIGGSIFLTYLLKSLFIYLFKEHKEKIPRVFISHSWRHKKHYWSLVKKFDKYDFEYYDHSIPEEYGIDEATKNKIEQNIRNKIRGCSKVLVLGGKYANNYWIKREIEIAKEMNKEIIAIRPWGEKSIPTFLDKSANKVLGFNAKSIIEIIKD